MKRLLNVLWMLLQRITKAAALVLATAWTFRIIALALLVLYLIFWQADQGQDLLVSLNSSPRGVAAFFVVITITAFLNWHLPKYLDANTTQFILPTSLGGWLTCIFSGSTLAPVKKDGRIHNPVESDLARTFGVITFLIPAFGVINVIDKYKGHNTHPGAWLLAEIVLVILVLRTDVLDNTYERYPRRRWLFHTFLVLGFVALVVFGFLNNRSSDGLVWLFCALCVLAAMFLVFVSIRHYLPSPVGDIKIAGWVMWCSVVLAAFFFLVNWMPLFLASDEGYHIQFATISIVLCGIIFYVLLFSFLIFWGRSARINFAGIFFFISVFCAACIDSSLHDVATVDRVTPALRRYPPMAQYVREWLLSRKDDIAYYNNTRHKPYPIVIVNTYGGGIRAAAWTSMVIAHLDKTVDDADASRHNSFQDHVFAYSGASGGTIGASVACALRRQYPDSCMHQEGIAEFYKRDFLSPVIIGLIGRDFFASTFGLSSRLMEDRARLQEQIWERHMENHFKTTVYGEAFPATWDDTTYRVPLLFSNTTHVRKGVKGITAPVRLLESDFPTAVRISDRVDTLVDRNGKHRDLKLSTAAFLSARFPFISPAGRLDTLNHFLDGGIYENSGSETAAEIARAFRHALGTDTTLFNLREGVQIQLIMISLKSSTKAAPETREKNLYELAAPLQALVANVDGNALRADRANAVQSGKYYYNLYLPDSIDAPVEVQRAILLTGWQLSREAVERLQSSIEHPLGTIRDVRDSLIKQF